MVLDKTGVNFFPLLMVGDIHVGSESFVLLYYTCLSSDTFNLVIF